MPPRILILRAPGTNCDLETAHAFELAGGQAERVHINRLLEDPAMVDDFQVLCIPGGFSYGDDIAAGRILGSQIAHHLADRIRSFRDAGKLVLGICNGFQVLMRTGILLPEDGKGPCASLTWNDSARFEDRWTYVGREGDKCALLAGIDHMYLPVAHAEGKFVARDEPALAKLAAAGQLVLRYTSPEGAGQNVPYPQNPNGSMGNVAGICDTTGRVFGLMPHPERHVDPTQHPRWTREPKIAAGDGLQMFQNAVNYFS